MRIAFLTKGLNSGVMTPALQVFALLSLILQGLPGSAATSIGTREPTPVAAPSGAVPVVLDSTVPAVAMQVDVLFEPTQYTASDSYTVEQPEGVQVQSRLMEAGTLRVVVHHRSSGAFDNGVLFQVPLTAISGVVADDPVILTNFIVAGQGGGVLATGIQPKVRLVGLRDGQELNGRLGIELSATAQAVAGTVAKVEYYIGGVLAGIGSGPNFTFFWAPPTAGPFEITAMAYDSNGLIASTRTIPVVVTHVGTYEGAVLGSYFGLVRGESFSFSNDGYVTMTSTTKGKFTMKLMTGGKTLSAAGGFDASGNATVTISRGKGVTPLTVVLAHSSAPPVDQIHGRVADGAFAAGKFSGHTFETQFTVDRQVWNTKKKPATMNGAYTLLMPASEEADAEGAPLGTGYATVLIGKDGTAKLTGSLADGTSVTAASWVSKDGQWPVYASLYKGVLMGSMDFISQAGVSDLDGALTWMRPADTKAPLFKPGFLTVSDSLGAKYTKPVANERVIPLANVGGNGSLYLTDGGLLENLERLVTVSAANKALVPLQDAEQSTLVLTPAKGLLTGTFIHPGTQAKLTFKGAVLQSQELMAGYFLAGPQGGGMSFAANPDLLPTEDDAGPLGVAPLPVVKITAPAAKATLKTVVGGVVQVKGTATDKQGIDLVQCQVLHDGVLTAPQTTTGKAVWTYDVPVTSGQGGLYTVFAKAVDILGNESEVASVQFWAPLKSPLNVSIDGPGKVTTGYLGATERDVGKLLTITATPAAKKKFLGWTGSVTSSSAKITVLMKVGTTLQANFGD
jgi:hypothetical protein